MSGNNPSCFEVGGGQMGADALPTTGGTAATAAGFMPDTLANLWLRTGSTTPERPQDVPVLPADLSQRLQHRDGLLSSAMHMAARLLGSSHPGAVGTPAEADAIGFSTAGGHSSTLAASTPLTAGPPDGRGGAPPSSSASAAPASGAKPPRVSPALFIVPAEPVAAPAPPVLMEGVTPTSAGGARVGAGEAFAFPRGDFDDRTKQQYDCALESLMSLVQVQEAIISKLRATVAAFQASSAVHTPPGPPIAHPVGAGLLGSVGGSSTSGSTEQPQPPRQTRRTAATGRAGGADGGARGGRTDTPPTTAATASAPLEPLDTRLGSGGHGEEAAGAAAPVQLDVQSPGTVWRPSSTRAAHRKRARDGRASAEPQQGPVAPVAPVPSKLPPHVSLPLREGGGAAAPIAQDSLQSGAGVGGGDGAVVVEGHRHGFSPRVGPDIRPVAPDPRSSRDAEARPGLDNGAAPSLPSLASST
jgi:hypothetical protein